MNALNNVHKAFTVLLIMVLVSYYVFPFINNELTIKWIKNHKKPIIAKKFGENSLGQINYTLLDSDGNFYSTEFISLSLPDTIKSPINTKQ